jgi:hypothetical protein
MRVDRDGAQAVASRVRPGLLVHPTVRPALAAASLARLAIERDMMPMAAKAIESDGLKGTSMFTEM